MKKLIKSVITTTLLLGTGFVVSNKSLERVNAESLTPSLYSKIATAIDASNTNSFEVNKNPELFDSSNEKFISAVQARKDVETYASSIEASSAYEFSNKYANTFSCDLDTSLRVYGVTTDIGGKFATSTVGESFKQKIESYQYYYWFTQKYIVNIDWGSSDINEALSPSFKRELSSLNNVIAAKQLLRKYGTHVYDTYILGGKLEITKYYVQDASYELSETEKNMSASLNVIVNTAKVDAKVSGSVDLSSYESNSSTSSKVFTKLDYHAYGGNTNSAATAADLFQYKTQFGTGAESGYLYEAWTRSFNESDADLKIVSADDSRPIWDILDPSVYGEQIVLLKKAFDNMCFESYASKCEGYGVSCNYFSSLDYVANGTNISVTPYESKINLPESTNVKINISDVITNEFTEDEYNLSLSSDIAASLNGTNLQINSGTIGRTFALELYIYDLKAYALNITIKKQSFSGGYGTSQQPYLISNKTDLISLLSNFESNSSYYKLSNDIDVGGEKLDVGGSSSGCGFKGQFDGDDHAIKNFTIKASTFSNNFYNIGIFGLNEGVLKNLIVDNVKVLVNGTIVNDKSNTDINCGILAGNNSGVINNCRIVNSSIRITSELKTNTSILNVGGIAGFSRSLIQYCKTDNCNIMGIASSGSGRINVGGITGQLMGATLEKSYILKTKINCCNLGGTSFSEGGLVGTMQQYQDTEGKIIKANISIALVYDIVCDKNSGNFGYVAGVSNGGNCTACYYKAMKELSVTSSKMNGCIRKDTLNLSTISNALFADEWIDGQSGPVLLKHIG